MKTLKKISIICFVIVNTISISACTNSVSENTRETTYENIQKDGMNNEQVEAPQANSELQLKLDKAKKEGKAVFVIVVDANTTDTNKAIALASEAKAINGNAEIIQMNRDDESNTQLVAQWRLSGAPLPLILVLSPKGTLTGGRILAQATAENIAALVPSPKKEEVIKALSTGKSVFMVVSGKDANGKNILMSKCQTACADMGDNATIVEVNLDDPNEQAFLAELKVDPQSKEPKIYVINSKGQLTGTFDDNVNAKALTASAKKVASSCCAPGSGKTCD